MIMSGLFPGWNSNNNTYICIVSAASHHSYLLHEVLLFTEHTVLSAVKLMNRLSDQKNWEMYELE